jgi:hypothetical protein
MNSLQHNIGIIIKELLSATKYQKRKLVAESLPHVNEDVVQPCNVNVHYLCNAETPDTGLFSLAATLFSSQ